MLSTTRVRLTGSDDDQIELFHGYRQQLVGCLLNSLHAKGSPEKEVEKNVTCKHFIGLFV